MSIIFAAHITGYFYCHIGSILLSIISRDFNRPDFFPYKLNWFLLYYNRLLSHCLLLLLLLPVTFTRNPIGSKILLHKCHHFNRMRKKSDSNPLLSQIFETCAYGLREKKCENPFSFSVLNWDLIAFEVCVHSTYNIVHGRSHKGLNQMIKSIDFFYGNKLFSVVFNM